MPHPETKRRKIPPRRIGGRLSDEQRSFLLYGSTLRGEGWEEHFANEDVMKRSWHLHRSELMAETPPGQRPWGYWRFEKGLETRPSNEPYLVWSLEDTTLSEKVAIETQWLKSMEAVHAAPGFEIEVAVILHHIPVTFATRYMADVLAKREAEARAFKRATTTGH